MDPSDGIKDLCLLLRYYLIALLSYKIVEEKRPANGFCDLFVNWTRRFYTLKLLFSVHGLFEGLLYEDDLGIKGHIHII